jgi:hypothetical protein
MFVITLAAKRSANFQSLCRPKKYKKFDKWQKFSKDFFFVSRKLFFSRPRKGNTICRNSFQEVNFFRIRRKVKIWSHGEISESNIRLLQTYPPYLGFCFYSETDLYNIWWKSIWLTMCDNHMLCTMNLRTCM